MYIKQAEIKLIAFVLLVLLAFAAIHRKGKEEQKGWYKKHIAFREGRTDFIRAYQKARAALEETKKPESEFAEAILKMLVYGSVHHYKGGNHAEKRKLITLEKVKAFQVVVAKLSLALRYLCGECELAEKIMKNVKVELMELFDPDLEKNQLLAKASSLIKRLDSILAHVNLPEAKEFSKSRFFGKKNGLMTMSDKWYMKTIIALEKVLKRKEELAAAMKEEKDDRVIEMVILEGASQLQLAVFEFFWALCRLSCLCSLTEKMMRAVQVELDELLKPDSSNDQIWSKGRILADVLKEPL